jgi:hypothetical protein
MNTFPTLSNKPLCERFTDEKSEEAVLVASAESGYPILNKLFTFDPRTFGFELRLIPETDKLSIMTFYEANKEVPFYWTNWQDDTQYEVAFVGRPGCEIDERFDLWRITLYFRQTAS